MASLYPSTQVARQVMRELGYRARSAKVQGITQHADFWTWADENSAGERLRNNLAFWSREAEEQFIAEHAEEFARRTAELGWPWYVRVVERCGKPRATVCNVKFWH